MAQIIFWLSIIFIFYAYAGYPLMLLAIATVRTKNVKKGNITPFVSFIITAYNEEARIKGKIDNTLSQDYPPERLEVIVASDCSGDKTDEIVLNYEDKGVKLVRSPERKGKENAQNHAINEASGEVFVFSDVATVLPRDAVWNIVRNFGDETVGCVSSVDKFIDRDGRTSGEGAYIRYEMNLRDLETKVNSLVGLSGSFFAARRSVCSPWAKDLPSDFNTMLNSAKLRLRGISDPDSIGYYPNISNERQEYGRKVRTIVRGISAFMKNLDLLNPVKYGLFSWQIFSHKLCRWLVPFAMMPAFLSSLYLSLNSGFYLSVFVLQLIFYVFAISGIAAKSSRAVFKIPGFFVLVNLSILTAWYRYLKGENIIMWTPSDRGVQSDNATG